MPSQNQNDPLHGNALMTLVTDFDAEAVASFMKEGHKDVADLLLMMSKILKDKAAFMKGNDSNGILTENTSFRVIYKMAMLDSAMERVDGPPVKNTTRITLLMEE